MSPRSANKAVIRLYKNGYPATLVLYAEPDYVREIIGDFYKAGYLGYLAEYNKCLSDPEVYWRHVREHDGKGVLRIALVPPKYCFNRIAGVQQV